MPTVACRLSLTIHEHATKTNKNARRTAAAIHYHARADLSVLPVRKLTGHKPVFSRIKTSPVFAAVFAAVRSDRDKRAPRWTADLRPTTTQSIYDPQYSGRARRTPAKYRLSVANRRMTSHSCQRRLRNRRQQAASAVTDLENRIPTQSSGKISRLEIPNTRSSIVPFWASNNDVDRKQGAHVAYDLHIAEIFSHG